ncbi:M12 family metallopeptidase [Chitinimonas sp. PSY-7]|uniref:M12 family metallopeptidase n=1 Tax=Chitinimonas sp. PSY-7 TaxID=3459088 RepID=UPI00403FE6AD
MPLFNGEVTMFSKPIFLSLLTAVTVQSAELSPSAIAPSVNRDVPEASLKREKRAMTANVDRRWPTRTIPYVLTNASPKARQVFLAAARHIAENSAVRFVERTDEKDYVYLADVAADPSGEYSPGTNGLIRDCHTTLGMRGGPQELILSPGCQEVGIALHELMHTVGFGHEHQRLDRDEHVKVKAPPRIANPLGYSKGGDICAPDIPSMNFKNLQPAGYALHIGPYDVDSVMQYGPEQGVTLRDRTAKVRSWPRPTLSSGDIAALAVLYGSSSDTPSVPTDNGLSAALSKYELILADGMTGEVELQISPDAKLVGKPRVESLNPHIVVTALQRVRNQFTLKVHVQPDASADLNPVIWDDNRVFVHFGTAEGKTGVAVFTVTPVHPVCLSRSFRQLVSRYKPAGSTQQYCLEAKRLASNIQRASADTDRVASVASKDEEMGVRVAPCDSRNPLQLWAKEGENEQANGRLFNMAASHCLAVSGPFANRQDYANLNTATACTTQEPIRAIAEWRFENSRLINAAYPRSALTYTADGAPALFPAESWVVPWQQWEWY